MSDTEKLKEEIEKLKERNRRVELNKAWETSTTRKIAIIFLTYVIAAVTLIILNNPDPYTNALVPTIGFFLSTLSLPFIKDFWKQYLYRK